MEVYLQSHVLKIRRVTIPQGSPSSERLAPTQQTGHSKQRRGGAQDHAGFSRRRGHDQVLAPNRLTPYDLLYKGKEKNS